MAAKSSPPKPSSPLSSDASRRRRHKDRHHRRRSEGGDSLKVKVRREKSRSHSKRRRSDRRHSSSSSSESHSSSPSSSSDDYSSFDSEHQVSRHSKRHKQNDRSKKNKDKEKAKSHHHRRHKHKTKEFLPLFEWLFEIGAGVYDMIDGLLIGVLGCFFPGNVSHIQKQQKDDSGPVQLSKFLGKGKDDGVRCSAVSGKKILLKLEKTKEDKLAENNRNELLKFLNASYD